MIVNNTGNNIIILYKILNNIYAQNVNNIIQNNYKDMLIIVNNVIIIHEIYI